MNTKLQFEQIAWAVRLCNEMLKAHGGCGYEVRDSDGMYVFPAYNPDGSLSSSFAVYLDPVK
jgi:hypothetical protein